MDEDRVADFCEVTDADAEAAKRYLAFAGGDLDMAVMMYFESAGQIPTDNGPNGVAEGSARASTQRRRTLDHPYDDEEEVGEAEDDETMAKRLAQEWSSTAAQEVRAPIAPTRQVLQDSMDDSFDTAPGFQNRFETLSSYGGNGVGPGHRTAHRGVFNQVAPSVWGGEDEDSVLREATGGASEASSKSSRLARLFQPPFEIMSNVDLETARGEARSETKWIMINLQDNSDFASQTLNRDLWKDATVKAMVKENFVFLQYTKLSDDGVQYIQFYPVDTYPHIAILDPRTGERVKVWSEALPALVFISEVTEFLDRFSLDDARQNPIHKKARPAPKAFEAMSEEEQMNLAIMASVGGSMAEPERVASSESIMQDVPVDESPFAQIPAALTDEPVAGPETTRIQLRMSASRTVRRFLLEDQVQRIFEFVKAGIPEASGKKFKIVFNRVNLIDKLESTILQAGLKNASLVVEFDEDA